MRKIAKVYALAKQRIEADPDMDAFWITALIITIAVRAFM